MVSFRMDNNNKGGVLILLALLLSVIVIFTAFAIDINRLNASDSKQHQTAEYLALGALEAYFNFVSANTVPGTTPTPATYLAALNAAVSRAEQIAGFDFNYLVADPNKRQSVGGDMIDALDAAALLPGNAGAIIPGKWWFDPPATCGTPCPCDVETGRPKACFVPSTALDQPANAIRVVAQTKDDSLVQYFFARVIGYNAAQALRSTATASLLPREGVFLVDLSRSTQFETHLDSDPTGGRDVSEYAYLFRPSCTGSERCNCGANPERLSTGVPDWCQDVQVPYDSTESGNNPALRCRFAADYDRIYNGLDFGGAPPNIPAQLERRYPGGSVPVTKHFRNDYRCHEISYDRDPSRGGGIATEHYLIDRRTNPEPLNSILSGIGASLSEFSRRSVSGDRAGVLGFDNFFLMEKRIFRLSRPSEPTFQDLIRLTTDQDFRIQRFFFPRYESDGTEANTNFPGALTSVLDSDKFFNLTAPGASGLTAVDRFVVLFSDGLTNCTSRSNCGNSVGMFAESLKEVAKRLAVYREKRVALHVFPIGRNVRPHTLLAPSLNDRSRCMTREEAIQLSRDTTVNGVSSMLFTNPFHYNPLSATDYQYSVNINNPSSLYNNPVYQAAWNNMSSGTPFMYGNVFWAMGNSTGGIWAPVRPCCNDPSTPEDCDNVESKLNTACDAMPDNLNRDAVMPQLPPRVLESDIGAAAYDEIRPYMDPGERDSSGNPTYKGGRLICDPQGRSQQQQIQDYLREIMAQNPYVLVD